MTVLFIVGLIVLFFIVPYLTGNIYGVVFRKKDMGVVSAYFAGMAIIYAVLTVLQLLIVKFKFDFEKVTKIYHVVFLACIVLGTAAFIIRRFKDKVVHWDVVIGKKSVWVLLPVLLQGILYIVLKNPYFENNALLETARITMQTGTIYEYSAFTGAKAVAGFPLSNKLMFLPVLYAYISGITGVDLALLFNFVMPVVTFVSFYMIMFMWIQQFAKENGKKWEILVLLLVWIIQVGDGFSHSTAFRVLHSGYTGEAVFFGVLALYALYEIKNRSYLIALGCVATFPGLVKFDALVDLAKSFNEYWKEGAFYGGVFLLYILAVIYMLSRKKKITTEMLNLNLIITITAEEVWEKVVKRERKIARRMLNGGIVLLVLLMCGNMYLISDTTSWRSNLYGVDKAEYELLMHLEAENDEVIKVAACDETARWIKRLGLNMEPVVGFDLGGKGVWWYSYEKYDENYTELWQNINYAMSDMEQELMRLSEKIEMDYVVVRRITEQIPISNNEEIKCVYDTTSYLVYSVDKK